MLYRLLKRACVVMPCVAGLSGCDGISQLLDGGTTLAFQRCMNNLPFQFLDFETIRTFCLSQNERKANISIWGDGKYDKHIDGTGKYAYKGYATNPSRDFILTGITSNFARKKSDHTSSYTISGIWIEPGKSVAFLFLSDMIGPQPDKANLEDDARWFTTEEKGIKIKM
jgi:hypothetical protein